MHWVTDNILFTASSSSTLLSFSSGNASAFGAAIDNVSVVATPLPAALPMFGGALLALGGLAFLMKRKGEASGSPMLAA